METLATVLSLAFGLWCGFQINHYKWESWLLWLFLSGLGGLVSLPLLNLFFGG